MSESESKSINKIFILSTKNVSKKYYIHYTPVILSYLPFLIEYSTVKSSEKRRTYKNKTDITIPINSLWSQTNGSIIFLIIKDKTGCIF